MSTGALRWANRVALGERWLSWDGLAAEGPVDLLAGTAQPSALIATSAADAWRALAAVVVTEADALIIGRDRCDRETIEHLRSSGYRIISHGREVESRAAERPWQRGRIAVVTSGTTGSPRLIPHTIETLATMRGVSHHPPRGWLCPYAPGTYAWFQCAFLGLTVDRQDLVPVEPAEVDEWVDRAERWGIDALSATPTFWRRTFLAVDGDRLRRLPLKQLSLGGEPVDQPLLDRLKSLYPDARITHIYASSEAGACIVVSDGLAGFPREWLSRPRSNGLQIGVREGNLVVRSPWSSVDVAGGWIDTGDRVRVTGDRIEIVGRAEGTTVNVGGTKIAIADVTKVLASHPDVAWCRVEPRPAPIVGELPAAEVVLMHGSSRSERDLIAWCRERLPDVALPRVIRFRDDVPSTQVLKERR